MADVAPLFNLAEAQRKTDISEINQLQKYLMDMAKTNYGNVQADVSRQASDLANAQRAAMGGPESGVNPALLGSGAALTGYLESRLNPQKGQQANAFNTQLANILQQAQGQRRQATGDYMQRYQQAFGMFAQEDEKNKPFTLGTFLQSIPGLAMGAGRMIAGDPTGGLQVLSTLGG